MAGCFSKYCSSFCFLISDSLSGFVHMIRIKPPRPQDKFSSSMSLHVFGSNDQGECRVVDIFDSQEEFENFAATHAPVYEQLGITIEDLMPYIQFFEVEKRLK